MKKVLGFFGLAVLLYFAVVVTSIWVLVSFIVYLVKDLPFNWNSLYCLIGCFVVMIISIIIKYLSIKYLSKYTGDIE